MARFGMARFDTARFGRAKFGPRWFGSFIGAGCRRHDHRVVGEDAQVWSGGPPAHASKLGVPTCIFLVSHAG